VFEHGGERLRRKRGHESETGERMGHQEKPTKKRKRRDRREEDMNDWGENLPEGWAEEEDIMRKWLREKTEARIVQASKTGRDYFCRNSG
jgi:hypothetical protein